jgi:hypothetical protein
MNPRISELVDYIERERAGLGAAIGGIPASLYDRKPADDAWCIADVVHHLVVIDRRVVGLLGQAIDKARSEEVAPDDATDPILPTIDVRRVTDRTRKFRNPRGDPTGWLSVDDGLNAMDAVHADLRGLLAQRDLPSLSRISVPHPAFGPLSGYEWVAFVAAHMRRHADQIREIGAQLGVDSGK